MAAAITTLEYVSSDGLEELGYPYRMRPAKHPKTKIFRLFFACSVQIMPKGKKIRVKSVTILVASKRLQNVILTLLGYQDVHGR